MGEVSGAFDGVRWGVRLDEERGYDVVRDRLLLRLVQLSFETGDFDQVHTDDLSGLRIREMSGWLVGTYWSGRAGLGGTRRMRATPAGSHQL